jgi:hypothetical protein
MKVTVAIIPSTEYLRFDINNDGHERPKHVAYIK